MSRTNPRSLSDQSDEMSTRLILDEASTVRPSDFELLSAAERMEGNAQVALAATDLTRHLETAFGGAAQPVGGARSKQIRQGSVSANPLVADKDLIREFVTESTEHLLNIESHTLALEKDSGATESLHAIFRAFHTIKGLAGFLEFAHIQALAHEVETLLDLARNSLLRVSTPVVDVVLDSTDVVRHELRAIEMTLGGEIPPPSRVDESLLDRIREVSKGGGDPGAQIVEPSTVGGLIATPASSWSASQPVTASQASDLQRETTRVLDSTSVRVETAKLDQLLDLVGEMVIAQTLIGHSQVLAGAQDSRLMRDMTQLARITTNVQRIATAMRMVPIGTQFQKTARLVRDLSRKARKQIFFVTSGEDTELDKTIAEELSDPLLHMVRNSIDHGIETAEERALLGKDPTARIRIAAYHKSGQIVVEISDDGRGLNRERILAKAQQNGLIHSTTQLSDSETLQLIFEPGFSTAEKVTDISGRGVGMDVVRKHVQKLRGRIDIHSTPGHGTTFFIRLPLTLAIIEGLVVVVGDQRYIVPIFSIKEMFRPTLKMLSTVQGQGEMVIVHGALMPIVRLHQRFNLKPRASSLTEGMFVVAESQGKQFCLFVDDLVGKQEVVIKSLGPSFGNTVGVAGCAILGDGRVGLMLDMDAVFSGRT